MKSILRPFNMSMKVGVSLLVFLLLPKAHLNSCFFPLSTQRELYYFSLFLDDIMDMGSLSDFTYHIMSEREEGILDTLEHPKYYEANVAEWQAEINNKAQNEDIYKILYKTEPEDYFNSEKLLIRENSFVKAISKDKNLIKYLQFAKRCENHMANMQWDWDEKSQKMVNNANRVEMLQLVADGKKMSETSNNKFAKLRAAYLTLKLQHYLVDDVGVKATYEKFFKNLSSKSWVVGSAKYYYALAFSDEAKKNSLLAQTFDNSVDKRETCLRLFDRATIDQILPTITNKQDKSAFIVMKALKSDAPELENIKSIYENNPQSQDLALLVHREVSKLEDWLVTPEVTDFKSHYDHFYVPKKDADGNNIYDENTDPDYYFYKKENETEAEFQKRIVLINTVNKQKDFKYCGDLLNFIQKITDENKQAQYEPLFLLAGVHLSFLKQDWANFDKYISKLEKLAKASKYIKEQIRLSKLLALITQAQNLNTPSVENALVDYFEFLKNNGDSNKRSQTIKDQVALYCASVFIKKGELTKGILFLSKTNRLIGEYAGVLTKNMYHKLLELAEPKDYDELLALINKKGKSRFETFLTNEPRPYEGNTDEYYDEKAQEYKHIERAKEWDISKIKEYKSMYYLRHNNLDAAYNEIKDIPESYWKSPLFEVYMNVNTFNIDLKKPHQLVKADSTHLTKKQVLKQLVDLKKQLDSDPVQYADNNISLGNAYYNMSNRGNSWLMWDVYWEHGDYNVRLSEPLSIAEKYYADGLKNCKKAESAAVCLYMASICKNEDWTQFESSDNVYAPIFKKRFPSNGKFTTLKYWCSG